MKGSSSPRSGRLLAGLVTLLLASALSVGLAACGGADGGDASPSPADDRATVPDVAGDNLAKAQAEQEIKDAGLVPVVQTATSADVAAGSVMEQSPAAGEKVVKSSEVVISVSLGPKMVTLPSFAGVPAKQVRSFLSARKLLGKEVQGRSAKVEKGLCYKQEPGADDQVAQGSTVTVWISSGKPVVAVPDLVGMTAQQAKAALKKKSLGYGGQKSQYSGTVQKGLVMDQSVPAGTQVVAGTNVEVVISKGKHGTLLTVPQCVGQQQNDVLPDLRLDGFQNIVIDTVVSSAPAGEIVRQEPQAGFRIQPTEELVLFVSKGGGGSGTLLKVPSCVGQQKNDVLPDLRLAGFKTIKTEEAESGQPRGTIVKQIPKAGAKIHPHDPLILYISSG